MKHKLTASGIARARHCLWWARADVQHSARQSAREARRGNDLHAAVAASVESRNGQPPTVIEADEEDAGWLRRVYEQWLSWWLAAGWWPAGWRSEVAIAWNVKTGAARKLARTAHRDYSQVEDWEVPGTADAVLVTDAAVVVIDWKTGHQNVQSPETNPQLGHNGAALAAVFGKSEAQVQYVKLGEDDVYAAPMAYLDAISFELLRDELRTMLERLGGSEPQPGPHCGWCPARAVCPETAKSVEQVVSAAALVRRPEISLTVRDNEHAAQMLVAVDGVEQFVAELKKKLREYADLNGGIELPDGGVYRRTDVTTERIDLSSDEALERVVAMGLSSAIKRSMTWADVRRHGGRPMEDTLRAALHELGGVKTSTSPRYDVRPARKGSKAA